MTDKKLEKIEKILGVELVNEINAFDDSTLKQTIVSAEQAMELVQKELDENQEYQALREKLLDMTAAKKEVFKFQKAKISLALNALASKG